MNIILLAILFFMCPFYAMEVNKKDAYGSTALHNAVKKQKIEMVKTLLSQGADPDIKNSWGDTALHVALEAGDQKISVLLIEKSTDINTKDVYGRTPLDKALK